MARSSGRAHIIGPNDRVTKSQKKAPAANTRRRLRLESARWAAKASPVTVTYVCVCPRDCKVHP